MTSVLVKLNRLQYEFLSFCSGESEDSVLLGYDVVSFWNSILQSFSSVIKSWIHLGPYEDEGSMFLLDVRVWLHFDTASYSRKTESSKLEYFFRWGSQVNVIEPQIMTAVHGYHIVQLFWMNLLSQIDLYYLIFVVVSCVLFVRGS